MKIAVAGKGGVGKTTLSCGLALIFAEAGKKVLAIDADPDANLAVYLGFPPALKIVPMSELKEEIAQRVGGKEDWGGYFRLNPKVDDIPAKYCPVYQGIQLMVLGYVRKGGGGCICPENSFLKALLTHALFNHEAVIIDLVAGTEHLGRGTAGSVDGFIIVAEPNARSLDTALRSEKLAKEVGIKKIYFVGNKIRSLEDEKYISAQLPQKNVIGFLNYEPALENSRDQFSFTPQLSTQIKSIIQKLRNA
ncbi:MAG: AAA family ATPase [Elusimicrobiota bacterium]